MWLDTFWTDPVYSVRQALCKAFYNRSVLMHTEARGTFLHSITLSFTSTAETITNQRRQYIIMFKARALELDCLGSKLGSTTTAV